MKVLLVSHGYPPFGVAGVERHSAQTAEGLAAAGHEVTVLTRRPSAAPPTLALERETRAGVPVVSIAGGGMEFERFPTREPELERIFERMIAEVLPDVVLVTHLMHHSPGYPAIARRWGIPVVLELHDFFSLCPRAHLQRRSGELCGGPEGGSACARHCFPEDAAADVRWSLRCESFAAALREADLVIAPSPFVAETFESMRETREPIRVLPDAVADLAPARPRRGRPGLNLASIGITVEHKGFRVVIEALRRAALARARYSIFGLALQPHASELRRAAEDVPGLDLRLFGRFSPSELPALLADADALVVPSLVPETYSMVAREAFACGLPVIAARLGALPEAVREGENGWLYEAGDPSDLAAVLQRLDEDPGLLRRAAASIRPTDTTGVAARTLRLLELLEELAERRPHVGGHDDNGLLRLRESLLAADRVSRGDPFPAAQPSGV